MKTLATAGALAAALGLTVLAQRAAAHGCGERGFEISANVGVSFGLHWTPCCGGGGACCGQGGYADCEPYGYPGMGCYGPVAYPAYGYGGGQFVAPQPAAVAAPPTAPKKEMKESAEVQGVGYSYPAYGYDYNYNYAAWYGYPYYPDYGAYYGYGR